MRPRSGRRLPRGSLLPLLLTGFLAVALVAGFASLPDRGDEGQPPVASNLVKGPFRGNALPKGIDKMPAPRIRLPDARGGVLDTANLRGRPYAVTFLYTDCPDVCPLIGQELVQALKLVRGRGRRLAAVAVSVDPAGDNQTAVRAWLRRHRIPRNFHYLIGTRAQLEPVWKSYFVGPQDPRSEQSRHSASIWLVDGRGRWRTKFSAGVPIPPRDIAHDLGLLARSRS